MLRLAFAFWVLLLSGCAANIAVPPQANQLNTDDIAIHFFNVGTGLCVLVEFPSREEAVLMYDCGSSNEPAGMKKADLKKEITKVVNRNNGKVKLVLSHPHIDHKNLIKYVLKKEQITSVHYGGRLDEGFKNNYRDIIKDLNLCDGDFTQSNCPQIVMKPRDISEDKNDLGTYEYGVTPVPELSSDSNGISVYIIAVDEQFEKRSGKGNPNIYSLSLLIKYGHFSLVLPGDAIGPTELQMIDKYRRIAKGGRVTVAATSHHGADSECSNSQAWADTIRPWVTISSAGEWFAHPICSSTNAYAYKNSYLQENPRLALVNEHPFHCGKEQGLLWKRDMQAGLNERQNTDLAQYVTELNGTISVVSDGKNLGIYCGLSETTCGFKEGRKMISSLVSR